MCPATAQELEWDVLKYHGVLSYPESQLVALWELLLARPCVLVSLPIAVIECWLKQIKGQGASFGLKAQEHHPDVKKSQQQDLRAGGLIPSTDRKSGSRFGIGLFVQANITVQGMVVPTVDGSSYLYQYNRDSPLQKCPVFWVITDLKLTVNIKHHTLMCCVLSSS